jgi:hypothetical protein
MKMDCHCGGGSGTNMKQLAIAWYLSFFCLCGWALAQQPVRGEISDPVGERQGAVRQADGNHKRTVEPPGVAGEPGRTGRGLLRRVDGNGNGASDPNERESLPDPARQGRNLPEGLGLNNPMARQALMRRFDANGDGRLDASELAKAREAFEQLRQRVGPAGVGALPEANRPARVDQSEVLKRFDANGNGKLDPQERQAILNALRRLHNNR